MLTRPTIILQQSATADHSIQFHIVMHTVHGWDPTECNCVVNIYIYIYIYV
jgi:hypothetical protein